MFSSILSGFGFLALLLSALGTHGVLAYSVTQRLVEIGIRMAFGADRRRIVGLVLRRGITLAAVGLVLGVPGALAVTRLISGTLQGIVEVRPGAILPVVIVLVLVTLLASLLPALRAGRVDPAALLRDE